MKTLVSTNLKRQMENLAKNCREHTFTNLQYGTFCDVGSQFTFIDELCIKSIRIGILMVNSMSLVSVCIHACAYARQAGVGMGWVGKPCLFEYSK